MSDRSTWEPRGSQPPDGGIIEGTDGGLENIVSFKTGGPSGDQTLITDGDYSDDNKGFKEHHDHYGTKAEGGRIDDDGGDRGNYSGPGSTLSPVAPSSDQAAIAADRSRRSGGGSRGRGRGRS